MKDREIKQCLDDVIDTIHNPSGLATGDAVSILIEKIIDKNPEIKTEDVIVILRESGFLSADILKDFISNQLKLYKRKKVNGSKNEKNYYT